VKRRDDPGLEVSAMPATPAPCPTATISDEFAVLLECLAEVANPRLARGKVHPLPGALWLSVLGLMAGGRSLSAISRFGQIHAEVLGPLKLRRGPSVATLSRALAATVVVTRCLTCPRLPVAPRRSFLRFTESGSFNSGSEG
jgi:hypothetical protein